MEVEKQQIAKSSALIIVNAALRRSETPPRQLILRNRVKFLGAARKSSYTHTHIEKIVVLSCMLLHSVSLFSIMVRKMYEDQQICWCFFSVVIVLLCTSVGRLK